MIAMRNTAKFLSAGAFALLLAAGLSSHSAGAQAPSQQVPSRPNPGAGNIVPQDPTFRVSVDLVTTDAIPRDQKTEQFIADLKAEEFEIYEDGVKQQITTMELIHGGRAYNVKSPPAAALIAKAAGVPKGSAEPNRNKVAKVTRQQLAEIAEIKMNDLNCDSVEAAVAMLAGTARSMGVTVEG